jgi:hypothetical protein
MATFLRTLSRYGISAQLAKGGVHDHPFHHIYPLHSSLAPHRESGARSMCVAVHSDRMRSIRYKLTEGAFGNAGVIACASVSKFEKIFLYKNSITLLLKNKEVKL